MATSNKWLGEWAPCGAHRAGQVSRVKGNFGFIQPDDSSDEIFFMPRGRHGAIGVVVLLSTVDQGDLNVVLLGL